MARDTPISAALYPNGIEHRLRRGKNTQRSERSPFEYDVAVDLHLELPVRTANDLHICIQLAPQPRRHPGGV